MSILLAMGYSYGHGARRRVAGPVRAAPGRPLQGAVWRRGGHVEGLRRGATTRTGVHWNVGAPGGIAMKTRHRMVAKESVTEGNNRVCGDFVAPRALEARDGVRIMLGVDVHKSCYQCRSDRCDPRDPGPERAIYRASPASLASNPSTRRNRLGGKRCGRLVRSGHETPNRGPGQGPCYITGRAPVWQVSCLMLHNCNVLPGRAFIA